MARLLRVTKGMHVSSSADISQYIPNFTETRENVLNLFLELKKDTDNAGCGCCDKCSDKYFAGVTQAPAVGVSVKELHGDSKRGINTEQTFGGYANQVHETPGHKCYPYSLEGANTLYGTLAGNGDVGVSMGQNQFPSRFSNDYLDMLHNQSVVTDYLNRIMIKYIVDAIMRKNFYSSSPLDDTDKLYDKWTTVFTHLVKWMSADTLPTNDVVGISCADVVFGGDGHGPAVHHKNIILIHTNVTPSVITIDSISNLASTTHVTTRIGTQDEIEEILNKDTTTLNWSFGISRDSNKFLDFVFSGCRTSEADQYKVTVNTTPNIMVNAPKNVAMLVDRKDSLRLQITMEPKYMLQSVVVSTKMGTRVYSVRELYSKNPGNILLQDLCDNYHLRGYQLTISEISEAMNISLVESVISDNVDLFKPMMTEVGFSTPDKVGKIPFELRFQFLPETLIYLSQSNVDVYVLPIEKYSDQNPEPVWKCFDYKFEKHATGFGGAPVCVIRGRISPEVFSFSGTVLIRVNFRCGALAISTVQQGMVNPDIWWQIECKMRLENQSAFAEPISSCMGTQVIFTPVIPTSIRLAKIAKEQSSYLNLMPVGFVGDRNYALVNIPGKEVPEGLTNKAIYNVNKIYGVEEGDKYYFAQLLIPIHFLDQISATGPDAPLRTFPSVIIHSHVLGEFHLIDGGHTVTELASAAGYQITYKDLTRPWVEGYIELPVVFAAKDTICIFIPSHDINIGISVDLTFDESDNNGEESGDNPENPDTGNTGDEGTVDAPNLEAMFATSDVLVLSNGDIITRVGGEYNFFDFAVKEGETGVAASVTLSCTLDQIKKKVDWSKCTAHDKYAAVLNPVKEEGALYRSLYIVIRVDDSTTINLSYLVDSNSNTILKRDDSLGEVGDAEIRTPVILVPGATTIMLGEAMTGDQIVG